MSDITAIKSVNKSLADLGDILTYNIVLKNTGNSIASDLILIDSEPIGAKFILGSVKINGIVNNQSNITTGCNLGNLNSGESVTIEFDMEVKSLVQTISNSSFLNYELDGLAKNISSNVVTTEIKNANIVITQTVDKKNAAISDVLNYTIVLENRGNTPAENVLFKDTIPYGTSLIDSSIVGDFINGINLGTIDPKSSVTINFSVNLHSIKDTYDIYNECEATYDYTCNSKVSTSTNKSYAFTHIEYPNLVVSAKANKKINYVGYIIAYRVIIENRGSLTAQDINFSTILKRSQITGSQSNFISFVPNTVSLNGINKSSLDPINGFNIDNIKPGEKFIISFSADVNLEPGIIPFVNNESNVSADFYNSKNEIILKSFKSNLVTTQIGGGQETLNINSSTDCVKLGDELDYEITISNVSGLDYYNVKLKDSLPKELRLNEISIDGIIEPNEDIDLNSGIDLGNIADGFKKTVLIKTYVKEESLIGYDKIYNNAIVDGQYRRGDAGINSFSLSTDRISTYVFNPNLTIKSCLSQEYGESKDIITCFYVVKNIGNLNAHNVQFRSDLPKDFKFIQDSVVINNKPLLKSSPIDGINLGSVKSGEIITVNYNVKIDKNYNTITIYTKSQVTGDFSVYLNDTKQTKTFKSNVVGLNLINAQMDVIKTVDKSDSLVGDILTYNVELKNSGEINLDEIFFKDSMPSNLIFLEKSLAVNGILIENENPTMGFKIDSMKVNSKNDISFKAKIIDKENSNLIINTSNVNFEFTDSMLNKLISKEVISNAALTTLNEKNVNGLKATITADKKHAGLNEVITYTVTITNVGEQQLNNINFKNAFSSNLSFVENSFSINNVIQPDVNVTSDINIGSIEAGKLKILKFKSKVLSNLDPVATSTIDILCSECDENILIEGSPAITILKNIQKGIISVISANKKYAYLNDIITYTVTITNVGEQNLNNINFKNMFSSNLSFVPNSFSINDIIQTDVNVTSNIDIGSIEARKSKILKFEGKVITNLQPIAKSTIDIYCDECNENIYIMGKPLTIILKNSQIILHEEVNKYEVKLNQILLYNVKITNTDNQEAENVKFSTLIPQNIEIIRDSLIVNNKKIFDSNLIKGLSLNKILPGEFVNISFKAKVIKTMPSIIKMQSLATYDFNLGILRRAIKRLAYSNVVVSNIQNSNSNKHELTLIKTCTKSIVNPGDIVTFKVVVNNNKDEIAKNVILKDIFARNLEFISNSFKINGVDVSNANLESGVFIGDIQGFNSVIVEFKAKIKYGVRPPKVCNIAYISAYYKSINKVLQFSSNICKLIIGPVKFYKYGSRILHYIP